MASWAAAAARAVAVVEVAGGGAEGERPPGCWAITATRRREFWAPEERVLRFGFCCREGEEGWVCACPLGGGVAGEPSCWRRTLEVKKLRVRGRREVDVRWKAR